MSRFKRFRKRQRMTQEEIGGKLDVSRSAIRRWDQDETKIPGPVRALMAVCNKYRIALRDVDPK